MPLSFNGFQELWRSQMGRLSNEDAKYQTYKKFRHLTPECVEKGFYPASCRPRAGDTKGSRGEKLRVPGTVACGKDGTFGLDCGQSCIAPHCPLQPNKSRH